MNTIPGIKFFRKICQSIFPNFPEYCSEICGAHSSIFGKIQVKTINFSRKKAGTGFQGFHFFPTMHCIVYRDAGESDIPCATTSILPAEENFIIVAFHEPQVSPLTPLTILMTFVVFPGFQIFIFFVFAWEAFQQD